MSQNSTQKKSAFCHKRLNVDGASNQFISSKEINLVSFFFRYSYGGEVSSLRVPDDDIVTQGKCLSK